MLRALATIVEAGRKAATNPIKRIPLVVLLLPWVTQAMGSGTLTAISEPR